MCPCLRGGPGGTWTMREGPGGSSPAQRDPRSTHWTAEPRNHDARKTLAEDSLTSQHLWEYTIMIIYEHLKTDAGVSWVNVLVNRAVSNQKILKDRWLPGSTVDVGLGIYWYIWKYCTSVIESLGTFKASMRSYKHNDPFEAICLQAFGCFSSSGGVEIFFQLQFFNTNPWNESSLRKAVAWEKSLRNHPKS